MFSNQASWEKIGRAMVILLFSGIITVAASFRGKGACPIEFFFFYCFLSRAHTMKLVDTEKFRVIICNLSPYLQLSKNILLILRNLDMFVSIYDTRILLFFHPCVVRV